MRFSERLAVQGPEPCQIGTLLSILAPGGGHRAREGSSIIADPRSVASLASVGVMGLASLPVLMLASMAAHAPLAGPAVISLGYIGAAHALVRGQDRRAAWWILAVFAALIAWSALLPLWGTSPNSEGFVAALLAPILAAAPAVARRLIPVHERARAKTTAGTPERVEVSGALEPGCGSPAEHGASSRVPAEGGHVAIAKAVPVPAWRDASDLLDAVGFGLRHVGGKAQAKGIRLICSTESDLAVAADRQVCRRLVCALLAEAVRASPVGATVQISGRQLKGAVLLRVLCAGEAERGGFPSEIHFDLTALQAMVEPLGGTVLVSRSAEGESLSLRLAPAPLAVGKARASR
jgi:hypothetical protein